MLSVIPTGQLIGSAIDNCIWILAGAYFVFLWPKHIRRDVSSGKLTEEAAQAKLKKFNPKLGYLLIILGLLRITIDLFQAH